MVQLHSIGALALYEVLGELLKHLSLPEIPGSSK